MIGISRENHKAYHPTATDGAEVPHRLAQHGHQAGPRFVRDVLLVLSTGTQKDDDCPKDFPDERGTLRKGQVLGSESSLGDALSTF